MQEISLRPIEEDAIMTAMLIGITPGANFFVRFKGIGKKRAAELELLVPKLGGAQLKRLAVRAWRHGGSMIAKVTRLPESK